MKTMRKVTALILTMVLCVALGVPAFAADSSSESDVTTKTYTFGNIIVTVVKAPNEITPMPLGSDYIDVIVEAGPSENFEMIPCWKLHSLSPSMAKQ